METQNLTEEILTSLPNFVRTHLLEHIADFCQFAGDEQECVEKEQEILAEMSYAVLTGSTDTPSQDVSKQVNFWIASHDEVEFHIHIGGSACWIHPDSHALFFEAIPQTMLPSGGEADQNVWWVLDRVAGLYKILIRPESEFFDEFPDTLFGE